MSALEASFSKGGVSSLFDGTHEWKRHSSRLSKHDITDEEVIVYAHDFECDIDPEAAIAWGIDNGYLPADEKETCAVGTDPQTSSLQTQGPLAGLGARVFGGDDWYCAFLGVDGRRRILGSDWFDGQGDVPRGCRVLFVRKAVA